MRSSVLSVFSFNLLVVIQLVISTRQLSIREIVVVRSSLSSQLKVVYSWVSSAYRWKSMSCHRIRSPSGAVYNRYSSGPDTDPWGTPNLSGRTEEVNFRWRNQGAPVYAKDSRRRLPHGNWDVSCLLRGDVKGETTISDHLGGHKVALATRIPNRSEVLHL